MLPAGVMAAASVAGAAASAARGFTATLAGLFGISNKKDKERIAAAQSALTQALAGDASALARLHQGAEHSATDVGKAAYRAALQAYAQQQASFPAPSSGVTPIRQEITDTLGEVRDVVAGSVQRIGAGTTDALASRIGTSNYQPFTVPLSMNQILILGGIAAAVLWFRR